MNLNDDTMKNVELTSLGDDLVVQGKSPSQVPYPEELALGNIVKLNKPFRIDKGVYGEKVYATYGIIAEHVSYNVRGNAIVSLYLYTDEGKLNMGPNNIPLFADFSTSEFTIHKIATKLGYLTE